MASSEQLFSIFDDLEQAIGNAGEEAKDEKSRTRALQLAKSLVAALEKPEELAQTTYLQPTYAACCRVAIQLGLFDMLCMTGAPTTAIDLATAADADELTVVRTMRVLCAIGFAREVGPSIYEANAVTRAMTQPSIQAGHIHWWDQNINCISRLPGYLRERGNKFPEDPRDGLLQNTFGTDLETFRFWHKQPEIMDNFNTFMKGLRAARPSWIDWFPVREQLLEGAATEKDAVVLVDVAGGRGYDVEAFQREYPQAQDRIVLEELPPVIDDIESLTPAVKRIKHDFFKSQPVKGARAYYFAHVFSDWADGPARDILRRTAEAMTPVYSKLLINDFVLPDIGCPAFSAAMDIGLMAMHGGMERTQIQWTRLLESEGFEVVKFWTPPGDGEGIVEAVLRR